MSTYLSSTKRRKEDDTPPTPYVKGIQMAGRRHVPLPSAHWEPRRATKAEIAEDEALTPLQRCVLHPASGGETIDTKTIDLTITAEVNVGNSHGAQVVIVNREKIIKIYDPLYYPRPSNFGSGCPDPHRSASTQYRSEVEVFLSLRCLWGTIVPEYHGSWTCDVPLPSGKTREVRFIMMELIPGICMKNLNDIVGKSLPLHERQAVMNKVIDAESSIRGLWHFPQEYASPKRHDLQ
ncbi:MAG: hypothetical protein M4579_004875 [Chaenotheca gracillima]|nr:MAG: hypothetical protein M4579_004875 [Chaenotheca gracillima]